MRYAVARYKTKFREIAYRNYVTDALYVVVTGGHYGMTLTSRFSELFAEEKPKKEDNRTQDEIVDSIWSKISASKGGE